MDKTVHNVIRKDTIIISHVPNKPALPTTQHILKYIITPRTVNNVGVNTPPKVPNFLMLLGLNPLIKSN